MWNSRTPLESLSITAACELSIRAGIMKSKDYVFGLSHACSHILFEIQCYIVLGGPSSALGTYFGFRIDKQTCSWVPISDEGRRNCSSPENQVLKGVIQHNSENQSAPACIESVLTKLR